uniref:Uncharacterized protein n=1 Tax=Mola mola TaxID=94237 RepID=A0A3Q4AAY9_MOLML
IHIFSTAETLGHFPRMENIAAFKPISTSPGRSTCGVLERSSYCQSPVSETELMTCYQAFCVQDCPYRSSTPPYAPLLLPGHRRASLFLDGLEEDGTPFDTQPLGTWLSDINEDGAIVALLLNIYGFDREIIEVYSGVLPSLHAQSECRCPPSHPRVHPLVERYCIPNGVEDTTNDRVLRLNLYAHPLSYLNDQDLGTTWLSKIMTTQELDQGVIITVDLANGQYQVFYIIVQFSGLLPERVVIQRRRLDLTEHESGTITEEPWLDWQYMARNCNVFEMQNNGPLLRPDSVNCLQLPSDVSFSGANITFSLLTMEPNLRPGYNDFYNNPALQKMAHATQVRIHLSGQYHNIVAGVNQRHQYYAISEFTISGRCECHGHADHCDTGVTPYRCLCVPESHTEGNYCQRCAPLYNDKPFRSGDQLQPMNCRPCQCHGHALSCHYDVAADDQPDNHYRGGGGVCDNCIHNTTGTNCELCISGFFRLKESDPTSLDVCQPCNCNTAGTVSSSFKCAQVGGQCQCKVGVTGRQCADCFPGWYGLKALNPNGCIRCNCSDVGIISTSTGVPSCNQHTGQCQCKPHDPHLRIFGFFVLLYIGQSCEYIQCIFHYYFIFLEGFIHLHSSHRQPHWCFLSFSLPLGLSCDHCEFGYWNLSHPDGCVPCDCDPLGSLSPFCEPGRGQCECKPGEHVEGRLCDTCRHGYHTLEQRNSLGCLPSCDCHPTGASQRDCESQTGQCVCADPSVGGQRCDQCHEMFYGFNPGLGRCQPCACNLIGSVNGSCNPDSGECACKLLVTGDKCNVCQPGASHFDPENHFGCSKAPSQQPAPVGFSLSYSSVQLSWHQPDSPNSNQLNYTLVRDGHSVHSIQRNYPFSKYVHVFKRSLLCILSIKKIYTTMYVKIQPCLQSCSSGGCTSTPPLSFLTSSAPPQNQPPPSVTATGPHTLHASWEPPSQPNGRTPSILIISPETQLTNRSTVLPPESTAIVAGLQAFSTYQMRVVSINMAGSVTSSWTTARTMEGVPEFIAPPETSALSSTSLKVKWNSTEGQGVIVLHRTGPSSQPVYIVQGLKPHHVYNFTITLCTKTGCITSLPSTGWTLPAAPTGLSTPHLYPVNETTIQIDWDPPARLNGPPPLYQVERTDVSLSDPQDPVARGTRFPGNSYHQFPRYTLPINTDFTGKKIFNTRSLEGLLLSAFSPENQEEFLAVQIKDGRPYFVFDPQVCKVNGVFLVLFFLFFSTLYITATRQGAVGTIVVNNQYRGNSSHIHTDHCVYLLSGVFVLVCPGDAQLVRHGFSGCLRDVSFKMTASPSEEWKSLDWATATKSTASYDSWEGCPLQSVDGAHFLGHGYLEIDRDVFRGGQDFDISMDFRTDQLNAFLLFTYNTRTKDYMLVELEAGLLSITVASEGHMTELRMWVGLSYCDGDWKQLSLVKRGSLIVASVDDWSEETRGVGGAVQLTVDSPLYLGGVPQELIHPALDRRSHKHGEIYRIIKVPGVGPRSISGCVVWFGQSVNLSVASRRSVRVYLDGCPTSESRYNCRGNDSVLVYNGRKTQATDNSLQPFTEYLYRFVALASGGWAAGPWQRGRSRSTVPRSVPPPTAVQSLNGFSAKVSWLPPTGNVRGLIDRYELTAYSRDQPELPTAKAVYLANGNFTGVLSGLTPSTRYIITVTACAPVGCTESLDNDNGDETDVRSIALLCGCFCIWTPTLTSLCFILSLSVTCCVGLWSMCVCVSGLNVYSTHVFILSVCTSAGCTNSSQVTMLTSQLPPGPLQAPTLTLLDSRTILVEWSRPSQVNGVLEFYSIFLSHDDAEPVLAYNSSELFEDYTLRNLTPGTAYNITLAACTEGGCTLSPPSQAQTEESTPESVPAPLVTPLSPHAFNIRWTPPNSPNGVITTYGLWLDGVLILNSSSSQRFSLLEGFTPWSRHMFRLQACTAQGCGKGPMVEARTLEMAPEGPILLELTDLSSRSLRARWTAPPRPNGNLSYTLYYKSKAPDGLSPPRLVHAASKSLNVSWSPPANSNAPGPLRYSLQMRASTRRPVISSVLVFFILFIHLSPGPGPVGPPFVSGLHARSVRVNWFPPSQRNGIITNYTICLCPSSVCSTSRALSSYTVPNLSPLTNTGVKACTWVGCSVSGLSQGFRTLSAPPEGVPAPHLYSDTPTSVLLSWGPPDSSNGPLERWFIERRVTGTQQVSTVGHLPADPPTLSFLDSSSALSPWTSYQYRLVLHNQLSVSIFSVFAGPWAIITTRPSRPAGLSPPKVKVLGANSLQVTWSPPLNSNGEIHGYEIHLPEPRIFHVTGNDSKLNVTVMDLIPYTNYSVTVLACSKSGGYIGGCTESLPTPAGTLPTSPEGLEPLSVVAVSESFLAVSWQPPRWPNGPNIRYKLFRRKTHQPLAITAIPTVTAASPPPSEDLHRWLHVYSGTKLFYQDKGLSRFTCFQYQLVVHNDVGFSSGEIVTAVTMAGVPHHPPSVSAHAISNAAVQVNWTKPSLQDLQGEVEFYFLTIESAQLSKTLALTPEIVSSTIRDLWPSTTYQVSLQVSNGAHNTTKVTVNVTTEDGEPDGISAPEVVPVNSSTVRVLWLPPLRPNGAITGYYIYVNDHLHGSVDNSSGSYLLGDLLPFTVYNVQVEVCTVYACVQSNVTQTTTVEDLPADLSTPLAQVIGPRLDWSRPGRPSGIMLGYEILRRTMRSCAIGSTRLTSSVQEESGGVKFRCSYLQCPASHGVCGTSCFHPDIQVCCNGLLHTKKPHHHCCESSYLSWTNSSSPVCCSGKLLPALPDHRCCGGYYVNVKNNENCCPDPSWGRVSVGLGDSCCGGVPYSIRGGQLCCDGSLHDGYGVQCCGGRIVEITMVCCGDANRGEVHTYIPGFVCCGQEYINSSTSLCCVGIEGNPTMHPSGNATVALKCCGSKVIRQEKECCSGIGYDPERHVCADRPTPGQLIKVCGALCPIAAAPKAYCGACDLDPTMTACTWVLSADTPHNISNTTASLSINPTHELLMTTHTITSDNTYKIDDTHNSELEPFTTYEYRVRGWNSFGRGSSQVTAVTTNEDTPWGVAPPRWRRLGQRDDIIQLYWQAPARPNGAIIHYVILRDGQERYRGDENSFTDVGGVRPFQEYSYQLRVCNHAGCTDSTQVVAVTVRGVPEGVQPPAVTALSPSSLHVSWSEPTRPSGIIQQYRLNQTGVGTIFTHNYGPRNFTVTGLQPYTDYSFVLMACTAAGCGASLPFTGRTLQAPPAGVWSRPRYLIVNTSAVELYWDQPPQPNGHVSQYRLIKNGRTIFTGDHRDQNYTDTGLLPSHRYVYKLEASTEGGTGVSEQYIIQTPSSCPTGIEPPHSVTVLGPHSISLVWTPPGKYQPVNYNVLLNPGSEAATVHHASQDLHLTVTGLEPFTSYYIRVQACQIGGCGVGGGVYVRTLETAPENLLPPTIKAAGASVLEIYWSPPHKPNGLIISYHIYRRPVGTEEELLVFIWSHGPLEFFDASPALQPFSYFQYRVFAQNSKGSVLSQWALAQTLQAKPENMTLCPLTGAYSAHLKWSEPGQPNGFISHYRLVYKKHQQDPTLNSTAVTALTVEVTGHTMQKIHMHRMNDNHMFCNPSGSVSSPWLGIRTLEASPAGLANFTVEQREQGRALLLSWDQPNVPNGIIKTYNLYSDGNLEFSGLSRIFLFRRLEPWTVYSLTLEACTSTGCTHTQPQHITTAAAPPASQHPPRPLFIGPDSVSLTWGPPSQPYGPIVDYFLIGRTFSEEVGKGRSHEEGTDKGMVVTGLRPWTKYEFSVSTHNPAGHTRSPWVTVTTRQAPPHGLAPPKVSHLQGQPSEVLVSWTPPLEPNGVLQSYRIQRNNISFSFSFDPAVLSYTDEDLLPFSTYSYSITACTSEGCITSPHTNITTLQAPPATMEAPTVDGVTSSSINISWIKPPTQNGEVNEYVLKLNNQETYRGTDLKAVLSDLQPHTSYQLVLLACTSGGCTAGATISAVTEEAPPTGLAAPTLKVTGPESLEVSWRPPEQPNGVITGYELCRDGEVIYVGTGTHYHDFKLSPSFDYSYIVRANNSKGVVSSTATTAKTHPSAPSGLGPPTLRPLGASQVNLLIEWSSPAHPNGDIVSAIKYALNYLIFFLLLLNTCNSCVCYIITDYFFQKCLCVCRYEVRMEACTALGCSSSDWSPVRTLEAPPVGQPMPLLDLQPDRHTGLQTTFLLTWSPPAQLNGRVLHYEVYRRLEQGSDSHTSDTPALVYRNISTSYTDEALQPYTVYQYQVRAVNSAGRSASAWASGRTGPAPPEGVDPPVFLRVSATTAVVDIRPPARPNGIVTLYRVFSLHHNNHTLLSEGTSHQQTLHDLRPYTQYWVGIEACTCYQCCRQGQLSELHTLAAPPAQQPPPRPVTLTSRSAQVEWDEPLAPNGSEPIVAGLQPYSTYQLRAACFNNMGSTASNWTTITTLSEAPRYVSPFLVDGNLTIIWLDWGGSFALNGYLKEFSVTESQLRVYTGFYSHLHVPRTSQKSERHTQPIHTLTLTLIQPEDSSKQGVSISAAPVYSELWFILLLAMLGLFLLAILLGLVMQRYRDTGLTDTKIVGGSSRFSPMSVLRVPSQTEVSQAYSQHSLHRSFSQLIDRKYVEEDEFVDAIKALSSVKKEHTMFTDTQL